jgi:hypothetical protein
VFEQRIPEQPSSAALAGTENVNDLGLATAYNAWKGHTLMWRSSMWTLSIWGIAIASIVVLAVLRGSRGIRTLGICFLAVMVAIVAWNVYVNLPP